MSKELEVQEQKDLMTALKTSLYPGASDDSCQLVLSFCRAAGMNPILKPVHIVPMYNSKTRQMHDTIMPGIGMYRINAERSSAYAGLSEPEFGPEIAEEFPEESYEKEWQGKKTQHKRKSVKVVYPKWCKITVNKIVNGEIYKFSAMEFWKENYATAGRESNQPNEMWTNRPYGQLAKCTEAQALRKAFPDRVSSQPTGEEMEGKHAEFSGQTVEAEPAYTEPRAKAEPDTRAAYASRSEEPPTQKRKSTPTPAPEPTPAPPVDRLTSDQVQLVQTKWNELAKRCPLTHKEGAQYLRQKFGFQTFDQIKSADLTDIFVEMNAMSDPLTLPVVDADAF